MVSRQRVYWFIGVLVLTALAWVAALPDYVGLCPPYGVDGKYACVDRLIIFGWPWALLLSGLSLGLLLSMFTDLRVFKLWRVFTLIYFSIAIILVLLSPEVGDILEPDKETVALWLSVLFVILSILLISYKSWRLKK